MEMMPRPEFARHVRSGLSRNADTGSCRSTTGMKSGLRKRTRRSMPGKFADCWTAISGPCVARNDRTLQSVAEPGTNAAASGTVVMQIFMKRSGHGVLDRGSDGVGCESRSKPLSKAGHAPAVISSMSGCLADSGTSDHAAGGSLAEG